MISTKTLEIKNIIFNNKIKINILRKCYKLIKCTREKENL